MQQGLSGQSDCERKQCVCGTTHRIREVALSLTPCKPAAHLLRPSSSMYRHEVVSLMMESEGEVHLAKGLTVEYVGVSEELAHEPMWSTSQV